jgi:phage tail-like protein
MPSATRADPSPSFRFHVNIQGVGVARFTECSGLEVEQEVLEYKEGGLNSRVHKLPGRYKFTNITLKRGIATDGSPLWDWVQKNVQAADNGTATAHDVTVTLLDLSGRQPLRTWTFRNAYPVKWSATALSTEQSAIAIESLALAHDGMSFA